MNCGAETRLSPAWCRRQPLDHLPGAAARLALRTLLTSTSGGVRIQGAEWIEKRSDPLIFALTHHNSFETLVAPAALVALRGGRRIRFLVDWMFLELPLAGWLIRQLDPIAIYRKPAKLRWRESRRRAGLAGLPAADRALAALASGTSIGIYPEGRRNGDPFVLAPARRGLGVLHLRSGAPVLPVGIDFPARDRLRRTPRFGKLVLRIGQPLEFGDLHRRWLESGPPDSAPRREAERELAPRIADEVHFRLARLARKIHLPEETAP